MDALTEKEVKKLNGINIHTKGMSFGAKIQAIIEILNSGAGAPGPQGPQGLPGLAGPQGLPGPCSEIPFGAPVNAKFAKETLTISGVVVAGETVTIDNPEIDGVDVFEFATDALLTVSEGHKPVDISAGAAKADVNLSISVQPSLGDTFTIHGTVYTIVPVGTGSAQGEIELGALLIDTQTNIVAAINGYDPLVSCGEFANNIAKITALKGGTIGNSYEVSGTFVAPANQFSAAMLTNGTDCIATAAVTALILAINELDSQGVNADADGATKVVISSVIGGLYGNGIIIGEDMANGSFTNDAVLLSGGADGTPGTERTVFTDGTFIYFCSADNTIYDNNWTRYSVGATY